MFGEVAEITQQTTWVEKDAIDLNQLKQKLFDRYPALTDLPLIFSVNHKICSDNILFQPNAEVGIMPPFSGG